MMKRKLKTSLTIKNRLIASFLVVLLLPCTAIGWFSYQVASKQLTEEMVDHADQSIQVVNNQVNELISSSLSDLDYLAKTINGGMIDGMESPELRTVLDPYKAVNPQFDNVFFGTADGLMPTVPAKEMAEGFDPRTRPWYTKAMEQKGSAIVNEPIVSGDGSGKVVLILSKAVEDGSGVVGLTLNLAGLSEQVNNIQIGERGYALVLARDRSFLAHPTVPPGTPNEDPASLAYFEKETGVVDFVFKGLPKKTVFVTNPLTGWKIIGTIEVTEIAEASRGILYTTLAVIAGSVILGLLLVFWIIRSITTPLKRLMHATEKISGGDLTEEVDIRSKDELGQLSESVNNMVHKLRDLIGDVLNSSQNVAAASEQISATTQEIASGSSSQAQAAQTMQQQFRELSVAINSVASSAEEAAELAAKTTSIAHEGGGKVNKSVERMNQVSVQMKRLEEDSVKIGEIIEVIDEIAEQTNLLALNAAIEAARAGEQGRGFAVVADEVRKLAERSGDATKQITSIIKGMQENTHKSVLAVSEGVSQTQETGRAFGEIIGMINETEQKVNEIAAASEEQAAQSNEVLQSIESISAVSEEAAAASEETAATSQSLAQLAESLNDSVTVFKIR